MMKRKMSVWFVLLIVGVFLYSGCASGPASWKTEDSNGLKGQSDEFVISKFGQPYKKATDSNGNQMWEYRKPCEARSGFNTFAKISSFGLTGDVYVDVLKITFNNDRRVVNFTYEENVIGDFSGGISGK